MISLVVAKAKNNVIGSKGKIPWLLRGDLIKLKNLTLGKVVILGRKTYESMAWYYNKSGREMPGKMYIIVTTNPEYKSMRDKTTIAHSLPGALEKARELDDKEIFVIGGAQLYEAALPEADRIYMTSVDAEIDGDTYFPVFNEHEWHIIHEEAHKKDEQNSYDYTFLTYDRIRK